MYEVYDHQSHKSIKYGYYDDSVVFVDSIVDCDQDENEEYVEISDTKNIDLLC